MKLIDKLKKIALYIATMPLWEALLLGFSLVFFILVLREGYLLIRYSPSTVIKTIAFWAILIIFSLLFKWIDNRYKKKKAEK